MAALIGQVEDENKLSWRIRSRRWWKGFRAERKLFGSLYALRRELGNCIPGWRRVSDLYWSIRHRTINRYNIVKIPTLKPNYWDVDSRLLHSMMALLVYFVEKEKPFERIDWDSDDEHKKIAAAIKEIYNWWKNVYPKYEENDPIEVWHKLRPKREDDKMWDSIVHSVDEDGDPTTYELKMDSHYTEEQKAQQAEAYRLSREYEIKTDLETTEMMKKLCEIRQYLWT